jgi:hypothetical protein
MQEALCTVDGAIYPRERLKVRTMNFGQHWRTPNVDEVDYEIVLPQAFVIEWLDANLPEYIADAKAFPDPDSALDSALRERGWPAAAAILADAEVARLALDTFAYDLLVACLGAPPAGVAPSFVLNSVDLAFMGPDGPTLRGRGRRTGAPVLFQDD